VRGNITAVIAVLAASVHANVEPPKLLDDHLQVQLVASDPDIVTPVGLAIDRNDRLFVLESHTHSPPAKYKGPTSDQIKIFTDGDRDGTFENITTFADDIQDGMNIAFSPDGDLFVVTSRAVYALHDRDKDRKSESRTKVLELITPEPPYEHAALLGLTFSPDGQWLYVSRGNTGSLRYTIKGTDGSAVSNYGDGGNIVRCRIDGSKVEEVATGFWNPFDLKFDTNGRLFCVDNDPDARGPNRLVHVIPGGDYGYKSLFGGGGNHPYQSWNGELPGTLPIVSGLGEAPCGLIDASFTSLPADYEGCVLSTVWGEHNLTLTKLSPKGISVVGENRIIVEGTQDFRPVAIAADSTGAVFITDWVQRDYPNHGHGRIWKLTAKDGHGNTRKLPAAPKAGGFQSPDFENPDALTSPDPFLRSLAVTALASKSSPEQLVALTAQENADVRLGAVLALRRTNRDDVAPIATRLLSDPDPRVRQMTLIWIGERAMTDLRGDLEKALDFPDVSATLLETYLATVEMLTPEFVQAYRGKTKPNANGLPRRLDPKVIEEMVRDESNGPLLRSLALTRLENPEAPENFRLLRSLVDSDNARPRLEAVRTLAKTTHPDAGDVLLKLARNAEGPADLRAEAILALTHHPIEVSPQLLRWLDDDAPAVRIQAARSLRTAADESVRAQMRKKLDAIMKTNDPASVAIAEQLHLALFPPGANDAPPLPTPRPDTLQSWQSALATGGDPASGRRVFFSQQTGCAQCHTIHNRGGRIGPDLSNIAQSRDRNQLVHAILKPSDEYSIDYQAWFIRTKDRDTHLGLQLDLKDKGDIELFTLDAKTTRFRARDIAGYGALKQSIMPDGLDSAMTVTDLRDLIAFLSSLK
jgi:hypothetical protein